jgi:hypothetical protein
MQDRINQVDETSCNARPDHTVGSIATELNLSDDIRFSLESDRLTDIPDWQLRAIAEVITLIRSPRRRV